LASFEKSEVLGREKFPCSGGLLTNKVSI